MECPKLGKLFYSADKEKKKRGIALYVRQDIEAKFLKADPEGRILMVEAQLNFRKTLLVVIYAPNEKQDKFFTTLYKDPTIREYEHICLFGDYKTIMVRKMDYKKEGKGKSKWKTFPKIFFQMTEELEYGGCMAQLK